MPFSPVLPFDTLRTSNTGTRTGFTEAARAEAARHDAIPSTLRQAQDTAGLGHRLVNLATLDRDLRRAEQVWAREVRED